MEIEDLTPEQLMFISSLKHGCSTIENDVKDAFEDAETMQDFIDASINSLESISAEAIGTIEEIQKVFGITEKKDEDAEKAVIFVEHIQKHLKGGQKVICKICGKTVDEIYEEESK